MYSLASDTALFRLAIKITDESFDADKLTHYNLYLSVGNANIRVGVADKDRNKFILLEDYELSGIFTPVQVAQRIKEIIGQHPFLSKPDWAGIRISIKNQKFTLIPATLFEESAASEYLEINCDVDQQQEKICTFRHAGLEVVNVFTLDQSVAGIFTELFGEKKINYIHHTSTLLEGLLHSGERTAHRKMCVFVDQNNLNCMVLQGGHLEFCNQFQYATAEDFLYYLIFAMQEQNLNPDSDAVTIWGDITHDSALFTLMRKYIRHVNFGSKPSGVNYTYKLEDQFEHRFFEVYSLHFCE